MKVDMKGNMMRLAAVDLDGTLLGADLRVSGENRRAVERLQEAGMEVVIASGRHYGSIFPFADGLPGVRWIVSVQGAEVSDKARELVLRRVFLEEPGAREVIELGHRLGFSAMIYTPGGILTESEDREDLAFYNNLVGRAPARADRERLLGERIHKIVWVGEPVRISGLRDIGEVDTLAVQKVHTHERLFEFMPEEVNKGAGLDALARHLGISAAETVVFGDAENDIPMFDWAGKSVAMAHGWPAAKARASLVTPEGPGETAFARAVEMVLGGA